MKVTFFEREEKIVEVITLKVGRDFYYRHEDWEGVVHWYNEQGSEISEWNDEMYDNLEDWLTELMNKDNYEGASINVKKVKDE